MNYELALQLKNAGFPQELNDGYYLDDSCGLGNEQVYLPTLSELIEACGERLSELKRFKDRKWGAVTNNKHYAPLGGFGSTPEEAVSRLWLELNKSK
jgi:hypothetical protein